MDESAGIMARSLLGWQFLFACLENVEPETEIHLIRFLSSAQTVLQKGDIIKKVRDRHKAMQISRSARIFLVVANIIVKC